MATLVLIAWFVISYLDFVMLYYICKNLTRHRIEFFSLEPEKLTIAGMKIKLPAFVYAIIYGVILGFVFQVIDGWTFRIFVTLATLMVIKFLSKRSNLSDMLLTYALFLFYGLVIQGIIMLFVMLIPLESIVLLTLSHFLTALIIGWLCHKTSIYKIFNYVKTNITLKIMCFLTALVATGILFIVNFDYTPAYVIFFIGLMSAILVALVPLGIKLYRRIEVDVARSHYIANQILAAHIASELMDDPDEIKGLIAELVTHINPKAPEEIDTTNLEDGVHALIEQKKSQRQMKIKIIKDIEVSGNHEVISVKKLLSFIGLLLDNAFESEADKPIIIYLRVNAYTIDLVISNEYLPTHTRDLDMMFEKGFSTKSGEGRGYGLHELKQEIESLYGKIEAFIQYFDEYKGVMLEADYIAFRIQFWNMA